MVGRSLPLELLCLWVKYRERRSADYGEEGFRDTRLAVGVGLSSCEKVYELMYAALVTSRWPKPGYADETKTAEQAERIQRGFCRKA